MKAAIYEEYGGPEVVSVQEVTQPEPGPGDVLVKVEASAVTSGDWRLRAAAFPSFTWLPGRLMFGLCSPRKPILGGAFAGQIAGIGPGVTEFEVGQEVFGFAGLGAHAEYLVMDAGGAVAPRPGGLSAPDAAALPFGGLSALVFLRDIAKLHPRERVLVVGASGGVGAYAVQIAAALGAQVDGVSSAAHADFVRGLGADRVFDYRQEDFTASGERWDVILDCVGAVRFAQCRDSLSADGRFVPLNMDWAVLWQALTNRFRRGPRVVTGVSPDRREDLDTLSRMVSDGVVRPVPDRVYPLDQVRAAYDDVESRHRAGAVVLGIS